MTGSFKFFFSSYKTCARNQKVKITNGSLLAIVRKGFIVLSSFLTLHNIFPTLNFSCNLLFASQLICDQNFQFNLSSSQCKIQDLNSRKTIDSARQSGEFYFFEDGSNFKGQRQSTCLKSISSTNDNEILL